MFEKCCLFIAIAYLLLITIFTFGSPGFTSFERFNTVIDLFNEGLYANAIELLEDLPENINGQSISSKKYFLLGSCYRRLKKWPEAIVCYQETLKNKYIFSDYATYHIAESYFELGKPQEALNWYRKLAEEHSLWALKPEILYQTAHCSFILKDYQAAIEGYQKFLEQYPKHEQKLKALYQIALSYQELGEWRTAFWKYHEIIEYNSKHGMALESLKEIESLLLKYPKLKLKRSEIITQGIGWYYHKKYEEARLKWEKAKKGEKRGALYAKAWFLIGDSYYAERKFSAAINAYKEVFNVRGRNKYYASAYYKLVLSYRKMGKEERANKLIKEFISQYPNNGYAKEMLYNLANYYKEKNLYEEAIKTYRKLAEKYPENSLAEESIWRVGQCYMKLKNYHRGIETYQYLIKRYPTSKYITSTHFWIGKCYERLGEYEKACLSYSEVTNREEGYYSNLARKYIKKLNKQEDVKSKGTSLAGDTIAWKNIKTTDLGRAQGLIELKIFDDAIIELRSRANLKDVDKGSVYYNLAICYHKVGEYKKSCYWAEKLRQQLNFQRNNIPLSKELHSMLYPLNYYELVSKYSKAYNLDPYLVLAVIREESKYDPYAMSVANARGLMQIISRTGEEIAKSIEVSFSLEKLFIPEWNIKMGSWYLKKLIDDYKGNEVLALAAYNGGPGNVNFWVKKYDLFDLDEFVESIPYKETREYVKRVLSTYEMYKEIYLPSS